MSRADKIAGSYELLERLEVNLKDNEEKEKITDDVKYLMRIFRGLRIELTKHQILSNNIIAVIETDADNPNLHHEIKKMILDEWGY